METQIYLQLILIMGPRDPLLENNAKKERPLMFGIHKMIYLKLHGLVSKELLHSINVNGVV
jgi:hypothetical protein